MHPPDLERLVDGFGRLALEAGGVIMAIYAHGPQARAKADLSPVSDADEQAEALILAGLATLAPDIPVVAEEQAARGGLPAVSETFILVDPLDGTREFLNRNGEFTVNIALIHKGAPIAGVVYAPALGRLWMGASGAVVCAIAPGGALPPAASRQKIHARKPPDGALVAFTSRSHGDMQTADFLADLPIAAFRSAGSSLKFCLIAEGEGDIYPRFGPTMEWDTAAGDAVLRAAGGRVVDEKGVALGYGKVAQGFRNGPFFAWGASA